jgi:hypothetical protein
MSSVVFNVTFDCLDARVVARFWAAVTGYPEKRTHRPGNDYWVASAPHGSWPRLVFVSVPEGKSVKNRVHPVPVQGSGSSWQNRR